MGPRYLTFLQEIMVELLEDLPLSLCQHMWFQNDGTPEHIPLFVRKHLNQTYGERWMSRWSKSLTNTVTKFNSSGLLPVGPHEEPCVETPVKSEGDLVLVVAQIILHTPGLVGRVV
jgi:hypothetical protein